MLSYDVGNNFLSCSDQKLQVKQILGKLPVLEFAISKAAVVILQL